MTNRKPRSEMTDYEKAIDWRDRRSPFWWRVVFVGFGVAGALWVLGAALKAVGV